MEIAYNQLLHAIMDIGEAMQNSGAEISRVEDSIIRMCTNYDIRRVNSFTITGNMIVTLDIDDETVITQTRRIYPGSINFARLDKLNDLSRYICTYAPSVEEIRRRYQEIANTQFDRKPLLYLGSIIAAAAFSVFFGGSARDALVAGILAVFVQWLTLLPIRKQINPLLYIFLTSFLSGIGAIVLVRLGLGVHLDKILIGCIMLVIPGVAITNAIRDLLSGDTFSGLSRLCESLLQASGIACGFLLAIYFFGRGL